MQIPQPQYNLAINSLGHGAMTGRMIEKIEEVLQFEKPDFLLVYGDTNSTLAGALAAAKIHVPVAHVEAGLRSFDMKMPEEINRVLTDRISKILFCPTDTAIDNLVKEGFNQIDADVVKTGDVMEDAALFYEKIASEKSNVLQTYNLKELSYYLCTLHRAENTNSPKRMAEIIHGINSVAKIHKVVLPVHPRTKELLLSHGLHDNIQILEPVGYFDMIALIKSSRLVITDSGGLQKEAYFFNKFCVTVRDQTEWIELVNNGYNKIVGASSTKLIEAVSYFECKTFAKITNLYGGGEAAKYIVEYLKNYKLKK
jgi:UDP-GlcNAc3NAcA epimerase